LALRGGRPALGGHGRGDWGGKASLLSYQVGSPKREGDGEMERKQKVMIKFIESWKNVLNEECDN
jgi:hypothetical protein